MIKNRKFLFAGTLVAACIVAAFFVFSSKSPYFQELENVGAKEALDLANTWRQENKDIASYVTSEHIGFELPDGRTMKVDLPPDQMVVSVAPYEKRTHR